MKTTKLFRSIAMLMLLVLIPVGVSAAGEEDPNALPAVADPGSFDSSVDPVVSLSYLNQIFLPQVTAIIDAGAADNETMKELSEKIDKLEKAIDDAGNQTAASNGFFIAIQLDKGDTLLAPENACELILRTGSAKVVSPFADQGLSDFTAGTDLRNGTDITPNHSLLIPRGGDGRGIVMTSEGGGFLMVRGEYEIVQE
jgi:hypothetical protein